MSGIDSLIAEHHLMGRLLDLLEQAGARLDTAQEVPTAGLRQLLRLNRQFGETSHHAKEEHVVFPLLQERGLAREDGPVTVLREEHRLGRSLMAQMEQTLEQYRYADGDTGRVLAGQLRDYIGLIREHMLKEEYLYRALQAALTSQEGQVLERELARVDEELGGISQAQLARELDLVEAALAAPA